MLHSTASSLSFTNPLTISLAAAAGSQHDCDDDLESDLMDLDEAGKLEPDGGGGGKDEDVIDRDGEEEFGADLNFGPKPLAKLLNLSILERIKWSAGFPLSTSEVAHRIMLTLDTSQSGTLPLSALDFVLKQIQGEILVSKETFDLAEVCNACSPVLMSCEGVLACYSSAFILSVLKIHYKLQKIRAEREAEAMALKENDFLILMQSVRIAVVDTTMPEDAPLYILHPEAYLLRNVWDPMIRALALIFFLEVPFAISYHPEHSMGAFFLELPLAIRCCAFPCLPTFDVCAPACDSKSAGTK